MHIQTAALCGAFLLVATAAQAADPMASTYANTVVIKDKTNGAPVQMLFNPDGTYTVKAVDKDGKPVLVPGKWSLKDNDQTICVGPVLPPDMPNPPKPACSPVVAHAVGDSWSVTNDQGKSFDVTLVAGR